MIVKWPDEVSGGVVYPESDGKPMADNTKQARWMTVLFGGISAVFRDQPDVFVAMNLFWYPVEGHPEVVTAPDVMVACGRPKGDRSSYRQWEEDNIPFQVVFEVLSPGNDAIEMADKFDFYTEHGVEEYYIYNPDTGRLAVYLRQGTALRRQPLSGEWVSPRLKIRFVLGGPEMVVYGPDGRSFKPYEEVIVELKLAEQRAGEAEQRAGEAEQRAREAEDRAARLAERLRQLGLNPEE